MLGKINENNTVQNSIQPSFQQKKREKSFTRTYDCQKMLWYKNPSHHSETILVTNER